jgi:hypothetical protein
MSRKSSIQEDIAELRAGCEQLSRVLLNEENDDLKITYQFMLDRCLDYLFFGDKDGVSQQIVCKSR